jgi:hypothetical protein
MVPHRRGPHLQGGYQVVEWKRETVPPKPVTESATTMYRGLSLRVDAWGWTISGRFGGYHAVALGKRYGENRLSIDESMAAAVAAADDLIDKGWEAA